MTEQHKELLQNKETALNGSLKDRVQTVTRAASGTIKVPRAQGRRASAHPVIETSKENARIFLVIMGILPSVPNTKQKKGAHSAKKVFLET